MTSIISRLLQQRRGYISLLCKPGGCNANLDVKEHLFKPLTQHSLRFHITQEDWCWRRGLTSTRSTLLSFIPQHHICAAVLNTSPLHIETARSRFQKDVEASKLMDWRQLREGKAVPPLTWTIVQADSNWTRCRGENVGRFGSVFSFSFSAF